MDMAVDHQPTVALKIEACGIEDLGGFCQLFNQLVVQILNDP